MVRSWGDAPSGDGPVVPSGLVPYLGGYGSSCGAFERTPRGASIVMAVTVVDGMDRLATIGPEPYVFEFPDGLTDAMRHDLDGAFGPAWAYEPTSTERLRDTLAVWAPHLLVVGAVLVTVLLARFAGRES